MDRFQEEMIENGRFIDLLVHNNDVSDYDNISPSSYDNGLRLFMLNSMIFMDIFYDK